MPTTSCQKSLVGLQLWGYLLLAYAVLTGVACVGILGQSSLQPGQLTTLLWEFLAPAAYVGIYAAGLLRCRPWARTMGIMGATLCVVKALYDVLIATQLPVFRVLSILKIPTAGALLVYLTRPALIAAFGKTEAVDDSQPHDLAHSPLRWVCYALSFFPIVGIIFYIAFRRRNSHFARNCLGIAILGMMAYGFLQTRTQRCQRQTPGGWSVVTPDE